MDAETSRIMKGSPWFGSGMSEAGHWKCSRHFQHSHFPVGYAEAKPTETYP